MIVNREAVGIRHDESVLNKNLKMQYEFGGKKGPKWAKINKAISELLNEDEEILKEANMCPYCWTLLPDDWEYE